MIGELTGYIHPVHSVPSGDAAANALVHAGVWITMKNHKRVAVEFEMGDTVVTTRTMRLRQATDVAGTGAAALNFTHMWRCAGRLYFGPATRNAIAYNVGEVVTGAGAATSIIHSIHADHLVVHSWDNVAYVASEVITGAGGATANLIAANFHVDLDIFVRHAIALGERAAGALNTFVAPAVSNKTYIVEVNASRLNVAGGFDCINADISAVGAADDTARSITYRVGDTRYAQDPTVSVLSD